MTRLTPRRIDIAKEAISHLSASQRTALVIDIINATDDPLQAFHLRRAATVATTVADSLERASFLERELARAEGHH